MSAETTGCVCGHGFSDHSETPAFYDVRTKYVCDSVGCWCESYLPRRLAAGVAVQPTPEEPS